MNLSCRLAEAASEADAVTHLFEKIAAAEGWQPGDQLRAHIERSTYFGAFDGELLVGGLQLVAPDGAGELPTHQVWPELPRIEKTSPALHAAVLAVLPEYRRKDCGAAFWSLGVALWRYCVERRIKTVYLETTPKMLRCYHLLGWPLVVVGELRQHWGEQCYASCLDIREVAGSLAERAFASTTYQGIVKAMIAPAPKA